MTKHILLVDDFLIANEIVKNELIKAGFAVVITVDPKKVLKILESQTIDLTFHVYCII